MFSHDIVKIRLIHMGYLPDYPYHLISDDEMFRAFLGYKYIDYRTNQEIINGVELSDDVLWRRFMDTEGVCYFRDMYPPYQVGHCVSNTLIIDEDKYKALVTAMYDCIDNYLTYEENPVPDWVYSYMLGEAVGPYSTQLDKHYLLTALDADNDFDEYTKDAAEACYNRSYQWILKYPLSNRRPPTMFGEPHVIKSIRVEEASMR